MLFHLTARRASTLLAAALSLAWSPRASAAETSAPEAGTAQTPRATWMRHGWVGVSAGLTNFTAQRTGIDGQAPRARFEGEPSSLGTLALHYERLVLPYLAARVFTRGARWETQFGKNNGADPRTLYDFGLAPVLTYARARSSDRGHALYAFVPVSFTLSHVPSVQREAVEEHTEPGTGFRAGVGFGALIQASRSLGFLIEFEWSAQRVSHELVYRARDGAQPSRSVDLVYSFNWINASAGLALIP
jgi:hypothetical protein